MQIGVQTFFGTMQGDGIAEYVAAFGPMLESRGIGGVWMSEHVVTFRDYDPAFPYPYSDDGSATAILSQVGMFDPMSALTALAMTTSTLRLGTGIAILPQRNPVYFAKMGTAIDLLSKGRFRAGVGLGWSAQEFAATMTPFEHRGSRMDEYLKVVRALWCEETASFEGRFYQLPKCVQLPTPFTKPHPPLFLGGESTPALRRVARYGQGWTAYRQTPEDLAPRIAELRDVMAAHGRSLGDIEVIASPGDKPCDADSLAAYADLGVDEVVVVLLAHDIAELERQADTIAERYVMPASRL